MSDEKAQWDNTNTGVLFKAGFKKSEKSPDYIGSLNVEGKEWTVFGRMKKSKAGKPFMSLSVAKPTPKPAAPEADPDFNDDIPF